jgi:hypothetical protein
VQWTGTGDGSYTGTDNPKQITINSPITETATWTHQYQLTVKIGGTGLPIDLKVHIQVNGKDIGTATTTKPVTAWVNEGSITVSTDKQDTVGKDKYNFLSWTGDASGTSNTVTITMNGAKTLTANYAKVLKSGVSTPLYTELAAFAAIFAAIGSITAAMTTRSKKHAKFEFMLKKQVTP